MECEICGYYNKNIRHICKLTSLADRLRGQAGLLRKFEEVNTRKGWWTNYAPIYTVMEEAAVVVEALAIEKTPEKNGGGTDVTDTEMLNWLEGQARTSRTGISFDVIPGVDEEPGGCRFMRRRFIGPAKKTLREAIAAAMREDGTRASEENSAGN